MDPREVSVRAHPAGLDPGPPEGDLGVEHAEPVTIRTIRDMAARGQNFASLTCYDATTARWLQRAGVHILLVGDTAAEVILGYPRTIDMPLDVLIALTAGVKRGAPRCMVMADMPFLSYQADEAEAIRNAGRFMTEGLADIVKIEADASFAPLVAKMTRAGIPICAHVGSKPQQAGLSGGYGAAGRTAEEAERLIRDAVSLEAAGAVMLLMEAVPDEVAHRILGATKAPVIGIGAGTECHGQVLVIQDLLGLTDAPPRFAEPVASLGPAVQRAAAEWVARVRAGRIGGRRYSMVKGEADKLRNRTPPNAE
jgi:3-methyl-2-oxobutanoate hydroxymethyltransferase